MYIRVHTFVGIYSERFSGYPHNKSHRFGNTFYFFYVLYQKLFLIDLYVNGINNCINIIDGQKKRPLALYQVVGQIDCTIEFLRK